MPRTLIATTIAAAGFVAMTLAPRAALAFLDQFDGTSLDPTVWVVEAQTGEVSVSGGRVTLQTANSVFPVVTTRTNPFPSGNFRLRVGMQYHSTSWCGDGFGAMDNFWENYRGEPVCRPFLLWQDSQGLYVYTGSIGATALSGAGDTSYHSCEWTYIDGVYTFSMDGVVRASGACAPRATSIFFGHPHPISCSPWTSFSVDFVEITSLEPTRSSSASWGTLKLRYR